MKFDDLLRRVMDLPVFETGFLLSGDVDPLDVRKQLARWTASGKVIQLRKGLYCLAPPYRARAPHPFLVANRLQAGSYVSLQSALAYHGMIPEGVPVTTSVATTRTVTYANAVGHFVFHHIQNPLFFGYQRVDLGGEQSAYLALPEKALLDLVYLQPEGDSMAYLASLRLQHLERLNPSRLDDFIMRSAKPKLARALRVIARLMQEEQEYQDL
jgi:predicted transcriptional regulator of viral defense system